MRRLPVAAASADACVYCASFHHAPVSEATAEAARVLRPGGVLVVLESAVYPTATAAAAARGRSAEHYRRAGMPDLAAVYFPIAHDALGAALARERLSLERFENPRRSPLDHLLRLPRRFPLLVARRAGGEAGGEQHDQ
jgi:ubiquinone/menaquinone biosynthesis C-methylase UbiE